MTEASYRAQIDATNQIIAADQQQLNILNTQVALGGVARANVLSQQATVLSEQATLPPLEQQVAQARNQLADYVGAFPADFHAADFTLASLDLPPDLPVSLPSALVDQRPDIQASAAQLHEASANVGVATANMLPQISLTPEVGYDERHAVHPGEPDLESGGRGDAADLRGRHAVCEAALRDRLAAVRGADLSGDGADGLPECGECAAKPAI